MKKALIITIVIVLLCLSGLSAIFSATATTGNSSFVKNQTIACMVGFIVYFGISQTSPHTIKKSAIPVFIVSVLLLLLVLITGTGYEETGSKSWINLGFYSFQPSELVKVGFIISFSAHISYRYNELNHPKTVAEFLLHAGVIVFLLCLQPDFGTAFVFIFTAMVMLFFAGLKMVYFAIGAVSITAAAPLIWLSLKEYQKNRILVFLNPELDPSGAGFNVLQSKTAIGSGGVWGQGLLKGMITQSDLLPAKHTDFIFSVIGEETGVIGCGIVLVLISTLVFIYLRTAFHSTDMFDKLVSTGIATVLLCHTVINTGMCVGLIPVTGIPLPFISYGGTFVITNMAAAGIIASIRLHLPKHSSNNNRRCRKYPYSG